MKYWEWWKKGEKQCSTSDLMIMMIICICKALYCSLCSFNAHFTDQHFTLILVPIYNNQTVNHWVFAKLKILIHFFLFNDFLKLCGLSWLEKWKDFFTIFFASDQMIQFDNLKCFDFFCPSVNVEIGNGIGNEEKEFVEWMAKMKRKNINKWW